MKNRRNEQANITKNDQQKNFTKSNCFITVNSVVVLHVVLTGVLTGVLILFGILRLGSGALFVFKIEMPIKHGI